jgi:2-alkyl-3-oxoalkanoate reductase
MRVFVAGATGVIGQYLVPGLVTAAQPGIRRFIAQSFIGWNNARSGSQVKTGQDPLDPHPRAEAFETGKAA